MSKFLQSRAWHPSVVSETSRKCWVLVLLITFASLYHSPEKYWIILIRENGTLFLIESRLVLNCVNFAHPILPPLCVTLRLWTKLFLDKNNFVKFKYFLKPFVKIPIFSLPLFVSLSLKEWKKQAGRTVSFIMCNTYCIGTFLPLCFLCVCT